MASDALLKIVYHLERVSSGEADDNQLNVWDAALRRGTRAGDEDIAWQEVATATLWVDPDRNAVLGERPFDVADAYSADTAYYYEHVFAVDGDLACFATPVRRSSGWRAVRCSSTTSRCRGRFGDAVTAACSQRMRS